MVKEQHIYELPETSSVLEAAREMVEGNVAALIVVDKKGSLKGILTERDLTRRVLAKGRDSRETKLSDVMTIAPDTLSPNDTAVKALELMRGRNYRHIPVVDGDKVIGMVSIRDLYATVKMEMEENIRETEAYVFGDRYGA